MNFYKKLAILVAITFLIPTVSMAGKAKAGAKSPEYTAKLKKLKAEKKATIATAKAEKHKGADAAAKAKNKLSAKAKIKQARADYKAKKRALKTSKA